MSEELQKVIDSNPEWYKNLQYEDAKVFIKDNINSASRSFVAIGYYLKYIRDNGLFTEDGYGTIWEFAQAEFGISKSSASRFMAINDRFSKDGNSPILMDRYRDFSSSKLSEMLTMTDEQLEQVSITTTVAEIREIKNPDKVVATSQLEPELEIKTVNNEPESIPEITEDEFIIGFYKHLYDNEKQLVRDRNSEQLRAELIENHGKRFSSGNYATDKGGWFSCYRDKIVFRQQADYSSQLQLSWGKFVSRLFKLIEEGRLTLEFVAETTDFDTNEAENVTEPKKTVNDEPEIVDNELENENVVDENAEKRCSNCLYNDITPEEINIIYPGRDLPCNTCDDKLNHWEPKIISSEPELVETVEVDIVQMVPGEPLRPCYSAEHHLREAIARVEEQIEIMRDHWEVHQPDSLLKHETILQALKTYLTEMQRPASENRIQPELPIMKNNDQRKEWAENYKAWGEWYYDENIDCHYYKYDFPNGDRLVVEEYLDREYFWSSGKKDEYFFHLLQKKKQAYGGTKTFEQKYMHQTSSMTEIIEYLKELQKKG